MKTIINYALFRMVDGRLSFQCSTWTPDKKKAEDELFSTNTQFFNGESVALVKQEVRETIEMVTTATIKLEKKVL